MSVFQQQPFTTYTGNGTTRTFAFQFRVILAGDLKVRVAGGLLLQGVDYTITGLNAQAGGSVTLTISPSSGALVELFRSVPLERLTDYSQNGKFPADDINQDLDRVWMVLQDKDSSNNRALRVPTGETVNELPSAALRANRVAAFDSVGQPTVSPFTIAGGIPAFTPIVNTFAGTGAQVAFTLTQAPGLPENCLVFIGGVYQRSNTYSVTGLSITFDQAPPADATDPQNIVVIIATAAQVGQPVISFANGGVSLGSNINSIKFTGILQGFRNGQEITLNVSAPPASQTPLQFRNNGLAVGGIGSFSAIDFIGSGVTLVDLGSGLLGITITAGGGSNNASGITFNPSGYTSRSVEAVLKDRISVKDFGALGNGANNDTTPIQNAINYAMAVGADVYFPGGTYLTNAPLNIDFNTATAAFSKKCRLVGAGASQVLIAAGTGNFSVLNIVGANPYGSAGTTAHLTIEGLYLQKADTSGTMVRVDRVALFSMRDVRTVGGQYGLWGTDLLSSHFFNCHFTFASYGVRMEKSASPGSAPNNVSFHGCGVGGNQNFGAWFVGCATVGFFGGSIEGNGQTGGDALSGKFGILASNVGFEGAVGLSLNAVYFEGNKGTADVWITGTSNGVAANLIAGCSFNRADGGNYVTNCVRVEVANAGSKVGVTLTGCGFKSYNAYVASSSRRYIDAIATAGGVALAGWDGCTLFEDAAEVPAIANNFGGGGGGGGTDTNSAFAYATCDPLGGISSSAFAKNMGSIVRTGVGATTFNLAAGTGSIPPTYVPSTVDGYHVGITSISPNFVTLQCRTFPGGAPADQSVTLVAMAN